MKQEQVPTNHDSQEYTRLVEHMGHELEINVYDNQTAAVECMDCNQVLHSADRHNEDSHPAVYIVIRGGMLASVYSNTAPLFVELFDMDGSGQESPEELDEMERTVEQIKRECIEIEYWEAKEL